MTLTYHSSIYDISEPLIRHFFRSKAARRARIRSSEMGAFTLAIIFPFTYGRESLLFFVGSAVVGALVGAAIGFWGYNPSMTKQIRRDIQNKHGHSIPSETIYEVEAGKLSYESLGVHFMFSLGDLEEISEDDEYLELSFGNVGLCVIPIRAFSDGAAKAAFITEIEVNKAIESAR